MKQNKSNYCTLYIVRHGQSEGNAKGLLQGQADYPLTDLGKEEARQRANEFKEIEFSATFTSDLTRAKQTGEILASEHNLVVKTTALLCELDFGHYNGLSVKRFREELKDLLEAHAQLSTKERFKHKVIDEIESDEQGVSRMLIFLRETALAYAGRKVLLVSHGGLMRSLLVHLGYASYEQLAHYSIKNLGYFVLESDEVDFFVKKTEGIEKTSS